MLTATVVLTLTLGIGMNTAIFSVLYGVVFQPLPFAEPDRLMQIGRTRPELPDVLLPISPANFVDLQPQVTQFQQVEARTGASVILEGEGSAVRVVGGRVTSGFFDLFGVPMQMGRGFAESDAVVGAARTVVVSDAFWRTNLGSDPNVVGSTVRMSEQPYIVIGVTDPDFRFGRTNFWLPFQWGEQDLRVRRSNFIQLFGRLAPEVHPEAASAELHALWTALGAQQVADDYDESGMRAEPLL